MRIAYVTPDFPYGAEDPFIAAEIASLTELGVVVLIVPSRGHSLLDKTHDAVGSEVVTFPALGIGTFALAAAQACMRPGAVARAARSVLFGRYGPAAKRRNAAIFAKSVALARIVERRRVQHIHAHCASVPSTMAYVASVITGIPWSCTADWSDVAENNMIAFKAATASFIRATSQRARAGVIDLSGGAIDGRCTVVPPAICTTLRAPSRRDSPPLRIVCPSRLSAQGLRPLLEALAGLRRTLPVECDVIGDGQADAGVFALIDKFDLRSQVHVRTFASHERTYAQLCNGEYGMAVFVDASPQFLAEAMLAGVPCIATSAVDELLEPDCAVLVAADPAAIAAAIGALCRDGARRAELGQRALRRARSAFDARANAGRLLTLMRGAS